ncbi:uncharacterized protein OCT59_019181 [Rhizophagus irregularis]|uniref:uncharacterized protein n=1 Tax=Rhizophagus irregularis TaxID=588596 RepID=UPI001C1D6945|nr:hypothetical protein OCT59_019181 [Rhizophagus irregularis]CAB4485950.1 unnamed protein product [Rhizophagus irregularis]CAB5214436.1 unnamed protein product [Rhizophagus irregularis]
MFCFLPFRWSKREFLVGTQNLTNFFLECRFSEFSVVNEYGKDERVNEIGKRGKSERGTKGTLEPATGLDLWHLGGY